MYEFCYFPIWSRTCAKSCSFYFNFPIVNFLFLRRNIPSALHVAHGFYFSQLIRYGSACSEYQGPVVQN